MSWYKIICGHVISHFAGEGAVTKKFVTGISAKEVNMMKKIAQERKNIEINILSKNVITVSDEKRDKYLLFSKSSILAVLFSNLDIICIIISALLYSLD